MNTVSMVDGTYSKWYSNILGGIAFLALFDVKANGIVNMNVLPILFICLFLLVLVGAVKKQVKFQWSLISVLFILLYLLYAFYAIYTRNPHQAGVYFENKLSFVLLPILFSFRPTFDVKKAPLIYGWIFGCLSLIIVSFIHSVICYQNLLGDVGCFMASSFSFQNHPTYTTVFYTVAFFLSIYAWQNNVKGFTLFPMILIAGLLLFGIFLCLSLAGLLFFLLAVSSAIFLLIKRKWGVKWMIGAIVISPIILYSLIMGVPRIEGEWSNATWYAREYLKEPKTYVENCKPPHSGTQTRIIMWTVATEAFLDYPMGVGTGNVDEVLAHYQRKYHQEHMIEYQYNPHNQFLQTGLEIGVFGLLTLVGIILVPLMQGIRQKNYVLVLVAASLGFNCLFESMLQRQSGIFYYTFLILILSVTLVKFKQSPDDGS